MISISLFYYPYKYTDDWEKINETSLAEKEDFYSHLNIDDITDAGQTLGKRVCKDFKIKIQLNIMVSMVKTIYY